MKLKNAQNYLFYLKNATLIYISQILIKLQKRLTYFCKRNCPTKVLLTPLLSKINVKRIKRDQVNIFPQFSLIKANFERKPSILEKKVL